MTHRQIMQWGKRWHYPFLQIGLEAELPTDEVLRHGRDHYQELRLSRVRLRLASRRIERWNEYVARSEVNTALVRVDKLLKKCS